MRKKSVKKSVDWFTHQTDAVLKFVENFEASQPTDEHITWAYEYAIIRMYREFENLILDGIVAGINNDTSVLSAASGIRFPKHLTDEVCEYILIGDGYFDFRGRDGLIKTLNTYLSDQHYIAVAIRKNDYKDALERLSALRNFAAHDSAKSKRAALKAVGQNKLGSAGSWLKRQNRLTTICNSLKQLAAEIKLAAPY